MQRATSVLVIASCLVLSAAAWAKRPEPVTCPEDIGTALGDTCPCAGKLLPDGVTRVHHHRVLYPVDDSGAKAFVRLRATAQ